MEEFKETSAARRGAGSARMPEVQRGEKKGNLACRNLETICRRDVFRFIRLIKWRQKLHRAHMWSFCQLSITFAIGQFTIHLPVLHRTLDEKIIPEDPTICPICQGLRNLEQLGTGAAKGIDDP